ncbi:MAG TPA: DUF6036 family nucleotidyltransferase [Solirubrobacteraceae bacterium]
MRSQEFEHVVAAAAEVTQQDDLVVIGSQAILGSYDQPPESMLHSQEVDIYPLHDPAAADLIDGSLGDGSQFHAAFGYYAHGVGPETAKAPRGWQERLVMRKIPQRLASKRAAIAWCLEVHDLVLSKCIAGRDRDWDYATEALKAGVVQPDVLLARVPDLSVGEELRDHVETMLRQIIGSA